MKDRALDRGRIAVNHTGVAGQVCHGFANRKRRKQRSARTIKGIQEARRAGCTAIVSHRLAETEDTTITDLVVAMGTGQIKTGAPARSERTAKYNRLMKIEAELRAKAVFKGLAAYPREQRGEMLWLGLQFRGLVASDGL